MDKPQKTSDGGSTDYYEIPNGAKDLGDLIEHKGMSFNIGNVFKACYRLEEKEGTSKEYDLRKIIYFAQRELNLLEGRKGSDDGHPSFVYFASDITGDLSPRPGSIVPSSVGTTHALNGGGCNAAHVWGCKVEGQD